MANELETCRIVSRSCENVVFDTISVLVRLSTPAQIAEKLAKAAGKFGFIALGINGLPPRSRGADPFVLAEYTPKGFREFYSHERFYLVDHICAYARMAAEPFRFSEAPYDTKMAHQHRRFMQALQNYDMGEGLVVPVGRQPYLPACVWLAGKSPELHDDIKRAVQLIALFAAARAYALVSAAEEAAPALSARECEVLTWTARGKSSWEVGEILNISKRTVDAYVQGAMSKLGAVNKTQAVVRAMLIRIIEV